MVVLSLSKGTRLMSVAYHVKQPPGLGKLQTQLGCSLYRFTVGQYHRLISKGILTANDRVELLRGVIINKMSRNPPHDNAITRLNRRLLRLLPDDWLLLVQSAVTLKDSEPEPDFAIVRGPENAYTNRKPGGRDTLLIIEVADSTLLPDRRDKTILYAQARIPQYWIVNLVYRRLEVFTHPKAGKVPVFRRCRHFGAGESIPLVIEGRPVGDLPVKEILPG
jgi:Uma2 family endonuclease